MRNRLDAIQPEVEQYLLKISQRDLEHRSMVLLIQNYIAGLACLYDSRVRFAEMHSRADLDNANTPFSATKPFTATHPDIKQPPEPATPATSEMSELISVLKELPDKLAKELRFVGEDFIGAWIRK